MSKKIVMSVLLSAAMSIGGFFVSCGSKSEGTSALIVQLPEGCFLISPKDDLGAFTSGTPIVQVKPGKNHFEVSCGSRSAEVDREIAPGQRMLTFSEEDLR